MSFPTPHAGFDGSLGVRGAQPEDYGVFVRLFPELGVDDEIVDQDQFVREMMATTLIAEAGRAPGERQAVGYAYFQIMGGTAYVRHLVTSPEARKAGIGRALMTAIAERARGAACSSWCLNVKPENAAAIALYERMGLTREFETRVLTVAWSMVDARQTLHDASISARVITPADDARVESAMRLLGGQLAVSRRLEGRVLIGLFDDEDVLGAAVFDPTFPGAYPFRVARPDLALVLLDALRSYARPADATISVVIEAQPAVADSLVAGGARVKLDIVHMSSGTIATAVPVADTR